MIKIALRNNLKYPLQLLIFNVLRDTENKILIYYYEFDSLIFMPLMFLGEFFAGLIIFSYQRKFLIKYKNDGDKQMKFKSIALIKAKRFTTTNIGGTKIFFLIFFVASFDFVQFMISLYTPKFVNVSGSIKSRVAGFLTIFDALFYYYVLRLPIFRHQLFSLIVIGSCSLIVIISEFFFQKIDIFLTYGQFILVYILTFIVQFCSAMVDSTEKYLFENKNLNPFKVLMFEGFFGFILSFLHGIFHSPFVEITNFYKDKPTSDFVILIFALIIYIILSGLKNTFRVSTTKCYTPMTTTFLDYILNPLYIIYFFARAEDFLIDGKRNYVYFFLNLIIAFIISFFGFVYNEFIVLFCCQLDIETHLQISGRSEKDEINAHLDELDTDNDDIEQ